MISLTRLFSFRHRTSSFSLAAILIVSSISFSASAAPKTRAKRAHKTVVAIQGKKAAPSSAPRVISDEYFGRTISKIDVKGLKRIEKDAVLAKLVSKVGEKLDSDHVRDDIKALFGMGFFDDIEVLGDSPNGSTVELTYSLRERPVISKISFEGNERISDSDLKDVIKVKEWSIFDPAKVKEDVALIQKHYEEKGFYLAKVSFDVKQTKPDEVELTYRINDYDKVQIKRITFLNNKRFTDNQLKGVFQETREGGLFSFLSSSGNFKESSFKNDLQRLTIFYLDHGYVKFRYENPVVTVSDDKKFLYISIYVDEGEQYTMGNIDFGGDLLFTKDDLHQTISLDTGQTFSITQRNADIQKLTEKYQDLGYFFTNVIPKMNVKDDTRTVDIDYNFEKGNLVYFNEINIVGNAKTHDKVIRRELKIHEGELTNGTNLRKSRENVERLGYFSPGEVIFNTLTPKGQPDKLNVEISVKERSTGTITLGAGYGSVQKFFFTTTVSEINLFGRGQTVSVSAQYSADSLSRSFNFGFTDPYAFDTLWSAGFDVYRVTFPIYEDTGGTKYQESKLGFDIRLGHPFSDYVNGYITYKNEGLQIGNTDPNYPAPLVALDQGVLSSVTLSVIRDLRNNRFETTDGNYQSASVETAGVGGDKHFIKGILNERYYKKLVGDLVFRNETEMGQMFTVGSYQLPPAEKFYLGGPNNMKGYKLFTLGPSQAIPGQSDIPLGGAAELFSLFEVEYPLLREAGLKWVLFYDAGNAYPDGLPVFTGQDFTIRTDAGFGIRWFSPIGPLRFEWGFPFNRKPNEDSSVFNFFIGPPF